MKPYFGAHMKKDAVQKLFRSSFHMRPMLLRMKRNAPDTKDAKGIFFIGNAFCSTQPGRCLQEVFFSPN